MLVTGASGYLGSAILERAIAEYEIVTLGRTMVGALGRGPRVREEDGEHPTLIIQHRTKPTNRELGNRKLNNWTLPPPSSTPAISLE